MSRNKDARDKLIQEKLKQILDDLLRSEDNRYCADCNSKGKQKALGCLTVFARSMFLARECNALSNACSLGVH